MDEDVDEMNSKTHIVASKGFEGIASKGSKVALKES